MDPAIWKFSLSIGRRGDDFTDRVIVPPKVRGQTRQSADARLQPEDDFLAVWRGVISVNVSASQLPSVAGFARQTA